MSQFGVNPICMGLDDYLRTQKISNAEFSGRIGVTPQALYRYRANQRMPEWAVLERIKEATAGAVTIDDFLKSVPPRRGKSRNARGAAKIGGAIA